jgi:transposase-like protein
MAWRCPACELAIQHSEHEQHPRPGARYRCHICRLELTLDPTTNRLTVVPVPDDENGDAAVRRDA